MRIRPAHLLLCGVLFVSPLAACGKDSKKSTTTTTSATSDGSSTTATSGSASSGNASLTKYCNDVAAFVKKAEPIVKAKDRSGALSLEADATALSQEAATVAQAFLAESDAQKVADEATYKDCAKQFDDLSAEFKNEFG